MTPKIAIHELKDQLSQVLAELTETGQAVEITKHGRVVAVLSAPPATQVVLGVGKRSDGRSPSLEDLQWTDEELGEMFGSDLFPRAP
jgi:prevent-host-death family protein